MNILFFPVQFQNNSHRTRYLFVGNGKNTDFFKIMRVQSMEYEQWMRRIFIPKFLVEEQSDLISITLL